MSPLLEENTYKVPREFQRRLKYALERVWMIFLLQLSGVFGWVWLAVHHGFMSTGSLVMGGFNLIVLLLTVWAFYWKASRAEFTYKVLGVQVVFESEKYFVPKNLMRSLIKNSVIRPFEESPYMNKHYPNVEGEEITKGLTLRIIDDRPKPVGHPKLMLAERDGEFVILHEETGERVKIVGATRFYKGEAFSEVYGPYALRGGASGHELRLQVAHKLFPFRIEGRDLEWMREQGIIDN